jgi:hypothetical protein
LRHHLPTGSANFCTVMSNGDGGIGDIRNGFCGKSQKTRRITVHVKLMSRAEVKISIGKSGADRGA